MKKIPKKLAITIFVVYNIYTIIRKWAEWEQIPLFTYELKNYLYKGGIFVSHSNIETKIENLLEPIINNLQYELYDVQYVKEGKDFYLRITIDNENGIGIEDCETVNNAIDDVLDEADIINTSYFLEVSSPGIERVLRKPWHFEKQLGNKINVKLFKSIDKQKEFEGILKEYNENELQIDIDEKIIKIDIKNIAMAKTVSDMF